MGSLSYSHKNKTAEAVLLRRARWRRLLFHTNFIDLNGQSPLRATSSAHECFSSVDEYNRLATVTCCGRGFENWQSFHWGSMLILTSLIPKCSGWVRTRLPIASSGTLPQAQCHGLPSIHAWKSPVSVICWRQIITMLTMNFPLQDVGFEWN